VKYFNQHFTTTLNKFPTDSAPIEALTVEYYTSKLHRSIGMFFKWAGKVSLAQNFEEFKEVENEFLSLVIHPIAKETKSVRKKTLLLTKPPKKESKDLDNVVKLVKMFSNEWLISRTMLVKDLPIIKKLFFL